MVDDGFCLKKWKNFLMIETLVVLGRMSLAQAEQRWISSGHT